jgi:phosphatidylglycerophosphate synthase
MKRAAVTALTVVRLAALLALVALFPQLPALTWDVTVGVAALSTLAAGWAARRAGGSTILGTVADDAIDRVFILGSLVLLVLLGFVGALLAVVVTGLEIAGLSLLGLEIAYVRAPAGGRWQVVPGLLMYAALLARPLSPDVLTGLLWLAAGAAAVQAVVSARSVREAAGSAAGAS